MTQPKRRDLKIPAQAVRTELARILSSEPFVRAPRMQRFLRFIVDETLAGRGHELGEYWIGVSVFDRGPDFEPALDPIVRNDARRLRGKLAEYYRQPQARSGGVIIEMAKGGYVPSFLPTSPADEILAPAHDAVRRLAVFPFEAICATPESAMCARRLSMSLTAALTDLDGVEAVAYGYLRGNPLHNAESEPKLSHVLNGSVWKSGDRCHVVVNLIQVSRGTQIWAREYEIPGDDMLAIPSEISAQAVREVKARLA